MHICFYLVVLFLYIFTSLHIHLKLKHFKCCILGLDIWFSTWRQNDRTSDFYLFDSFFLVFSFLFFSFVLEELATQTAKWRWSYILSKIVRLFFFFFNFYTNDSKNNSSIFKKQKTDTISLRSVHPLWCLLVTSSSSVFYNHRLLWWRGVHWPPLLQKETGRRHGALHFRGREDGRRGHSAPSLLLKHETGLKLPGPVRTRSSSPQTVSLA